MCQANLYMFGMLRNDLKDLILEYIENSFENLFSECAN